jgi:hypothetical protein
MRLSSGFLALSLATIAAAVSVGSAFGATQATPRPTITMIMPDVAVKGTNFLIAGTNFKGATSVKIGTVPVKFRVVSAKAITAQVPGKAKTGKLTVTTKSGTATSKVVFRIIPHRFA